MFRQAVLVACGLVLVAGLVSTAGEQSGRCACNDRVAQGQGAGHPR